MSENTESADITYTIYQLKDAPESRKLLFMPLHSLKSKEISVLPGQYDCVYSGQLTPAADRQTDQEFLDWLFFQFNMNHPQDFHGHSMSVSDVVTIDRAGTARAYYNDLMGNRSTVLADCELIRQTLSDTTALDAEMQQEQDEMAVVSELMQAHIKKNASVAQPQEAYAQEAGRIEKRYNAAFEHYTVLETKKEKRMRKSKEISTFITTLKSNR